jgi:hypothetical protein
LLRTHKSYLNYTPLLKNENPVLMIANMELNHIINGKMDFYLVR